MNIGEVVEALNEGKAVSFRNEEWKNVYMKLDGNKLSIYDKDTNQKKSETVGFIFPNEIMSNDWYEVKTEIKFGVGDKVAIIFQSLDYYKYLVEYIVVREEAKSFDTKESEYYLLNPKTNRLFWIASSNIGYITDSRIKAEMQEPFKHTKILSVKYVG